MQDSKWRRSRPYASDEVAAAQAILRLAIAPARLARFQHAEMRAGAAP
jgi:hypothetical protein